MSKFLSAQQTGWRKRQAELLLELEDLYQNNADVSLADVRFHLVSLLCALTQVQVNLERTKNGAKRP